MTCPNVCIQVYVFSTDVCTASPPSPPSSSSSSTFSSPISLSATSVYGHKVGLPLLIFTASACKSSTILFTCRALIFFKIPFNGGGIHTANPISCSRVLILLAFGSEGWGSIFHSPWKRLTTDVPPGSKENVMRRPSWSSSTSNLVVNVPWNIKNLQLASWSTRTVLLVLEGEEEEGARMWR